MNDDTRLIRRVQKSGDRFAAEALVRLYYDEISGYVAKQISVHADALDITQEIFISMLRTIGGYDRKKAGFRTWLYRIATYKIIDFFRSSAAAACTLSDTENLSLAAEPDFVSQIMDKDLFDKVRRYVDAMPADVQQVFRLKVFGGYTFTQIAELLSIKEATVKTRYYRLMQTLRKEFGHEYD